VSWKRCALTGWGLSIVAAAGTYAMSGGSLLLTGVEFLLSAAILPWLLRFMSGEDM